MKTLVLYFSHSGNNEYLARHLAACVEGDLEAIRPRVNFFVALILFSLMRFGPGNKPLSRDVGSYDRIVLCGPVWMGQLLAPMRDVIARYRKSIRRLGFATCCGSSDEHKDGGFGYEKVFRQVRASSRGIPTCCGAFPIVLTLPEELRTNDDAVMKARLNKEHFSDAALQERLDTFLKELAAL